MRIRWARRRGANGSLSASTMAFAGLMGTILGLGRWAAAEEGAVPSAADLLPATTLVYLEVSRPGNLVRLVTDPALIEKLRQLPDARKALESPQWKQFQAVVSVVEARAGMKWQPALQGAIGGGVAIAFDPATQGLVVLVRPEDRKAADAIRDALLSLAREDAKSKGGADPVQEETDHGLKVYKVGESRLVDLGPWVMFSNKPRLAAAVGDAFREAQEGRDTSSKSAKRLSGTREFSEARRLAGSDASGHEPAAWGYVRLALLRTLGVAKPLLDSQDKLDNPVAEMLAGGLLSTLKHSPYVAASLSIEHGDVRVSLASPYDSGWVPPERKFYFSASPGGADKPLKPRDAVFALTTYRDLGAFWQAAPDLFTEGVAGKMAQADSGLSAFLGGKSFSADLLAALEPQIQWVAARQDFKAAGSNGPAIRLPASALIFRIKPGQAKLVRRSFKLAYTSIVTFGNLDGASKGRPMLQTATETRQGAEILYATYESGEMDPPMAKSGAAKGDAGAPAATKPQQKKGVEDIYLNFSPALVLSDDYLILSTTRQLAEELADMALGDHQANGSSPANTLVEVDGRIVADLLHQNREQLIAQNMLEKGHDQAAAEREIDALITVANILRGAEIRLTPTDNSVRINLEIKTGL